MTSEARARTAQLAREAAARLTSPNDFAAAAEWLGAQDDVVSVATGPEAIRFRVRDGRGHWIFLRTADGPLTLGAPMPPPVRHAESMPGHKIRDMAAAPASLSTSVAAQGTTKGREKKALLLSPFRWQWEVAGGNDGIADIEQALKARDYTEVTVWTERLDPTNPACSGVRWDSCRTIGEIGLTAFTGWRGYDFIYVVTHGGYVSTPVGTLTAIMTPWTDVLVRRAAEGAEWAGNQQLADLLDTVGTETASVRVLRPEQDIPRVGPGQTVESSLPKWIVDLGPDGLNPGLSSTEQRWCKEELARKPDPQRYEDARIANDALPFDERTDPAESLAHTAGGKRCGSYQASTLTGEFILLTSNFFRATYEEGIDDAVIILSACSSGTQTDLMEAVRGEHTAVIGWKGTMGLNTAAAAGALVAKQLVEVDETLEDDSGVTVEQAADRIKVLLEELADAPWDTEECSDPQAGTEAEARCTLAERARVLSIINDVPADPVTGASMVVSGDSTIRAREIVYLVDKTGADLPDGGTLEVVGLAEDGRADSVDLVLRVDGLADEDPAAVDLRVRFEGRDIHVERALRREAARGVWELDYRLPLGRDHRAGERIDLEIVADLPAGGDSRWEYRDLVLSSFFCWFTATVSGSSHAGTYEGWAIVLGNVVFLKDGRADFGATIELPIEESTERSAWRPGTVRAEEAQPTNVSLNDDSDPAGFGAGAWLGDAGETATIRVLRLDGNPTNPASSESSIEAEVTGHLRWCNPRQDGPDACRRPTYLDVRIRLKAVPFAVAPSSNHRRCTAAWKDRWYGQN